MVFFYHNVVVYLVSYRYARYDCCVLHTFNILLIKLNLLLLLDHLIIKLNQIEIKGDAVSEIMMDINKEFRIQRKTNALEMLKRFNKDMTKELLTYSYLNFIAYYLKIANQ